MGLPRVSLLEIGSHHGDRPGPKRINPAPARQIEAPMTSQRSGRAPSTVQSHISEAAM